MFCDVRQDIAVTMATLAWWWLELGVG